MKVIGGFRFDYKYEYDYGIRHFGRQLFASSLADVMKSLVIVCLRTSFEENVVLK